MRAFLIVSSAVFLFTSVEADPVPPTHCFRWNEVMKCVDTCPPERTCETRDAQYKCLVQDDSKCETKCVCKDGFYRTPRGDCISNEQCDQCSGPHEYFTCGSACDNVCSTLHEQNQTNCPIVNIKCNEKCYCEEGHARDAGNVCVPIAECPKFQENAHNAEDRNSTRKVMQCTGPNEEFTCRQPCPPQSCITIVAFIACIADQPCEDTCACRPGFLRKEEGSPCIPIRQCPQLANSPDFH